VEVEDLRGEEDSGTERGSANSVECRRKGLETICEQRSSEVKEPDHEEHERKAHRWGKLAPMGGHEKSDSRSKKKPAKGHGQEDGPAESGLAFLPRFKAEDAFSDLSVNDASICPALKVGFKLYQMIHEFPATAGSSQSLRDAVTYIWLGQNARFRSRSLDWAINSLRDLAEKTGITPTKWSSSLRKPRDED
jgi:hypothetical protein